MRWPLPTAAHDTEPCAGEPEQVQGGRAGHLTAALWRSKSCILARRHQPAGVK
jgi:hypothetical protein